MAKKKKKSNIKKKKKNQVSNKTTKQKIETNKKITNPEKKISVSNVNSHKTKKKQQILIKI